jgi:ribonuclease Z
MKPEPLPERPFNGTVHAHRAYTIHADELDHDIPVLGVALKETEHLSVDKDRLVRLGLQPGAWLNDLKMAVRRCEPRDRTIEALDEDGSVKELTSGELADELLFRTPGQKIAYLCDIRYSEANIAKAVELAGGANLLVCEAAFLHKDEALARERSHLTARQAGELARAAGVERLAPFHFSPRYKGRERELLDEAAEAFGGPVIQLPAGIG